MDRYIKKIRKRLGHEKFIHPAARILIENKAGEYLFIKRKDNGQVGIPAGGLEEGESIEECIRREVREETGLEIGLLQVIGLSTQPDRETVLYPNGDQIQYFTVEFYCRDWSGQISADKEEVAEVYFQNQNQMTQLPANEQSAFQSLSYFRQTGKVHLD